MLDVFNSNEFELVVVDPVRREELHAIGREVRALEGHMGLQGVELKDYAKFVKALDQFLLDETEAAMQALQLAAQGAVVGDLQRFVEYWLGYMRTTVGMYTEAVQNFERDEKGLPDGSPQYFQLERIKAETRFFALAKPDPTAKYWDKKKKVDTRLPNERFEVVDSLLDDLEKLAGEVERSDDHEAKVHTELEVARTRADIFDWIAYDKDHLDEPLSETAIKEAGAIVAGLPPIKKFSGLLTSPEWNDLAQKPDVLRYWALVQAQEICEEKVSEEESGEEESGEEEIGEEESGESSMEVHFALAECYFKLRDDRAIRAFERLEGDISKYFGEDREKRHEVALQQSLLICHCRLFTLRKEAEEVLKKLEEEGESVERPDNVPQRNEPEEKRHIHRAERDTREKLNQMPRGRMTIFSHIQRRNLTREEFAAEVKEIVVQERIGQGTGQEGGEESAGK
ncbi:MAG TPA: hypothetical protein VGV69_07675 [Solirubrobacterales bacterium]|nr:hypothetical protein [Solirubrobacterales bacterium]